MLFNNLNLFYYLYTINTSIIIMEFKVRKNNFKYYLYKDRFSDIDNILFNVN